MKSWKLRGLQNEILETQGIIKWISGNSGDYKMKSWKLRGLQNEIGSARFNGSVGQLAVVFGRFSHTKRI
jgi:hypothetical protein